jgi:hypothetical protein
VSKRRISIDEVVALAKSGYYNADAVDDLLAEAECPSTSTNVEDADENKRSSKRSKKRKQNHDRAVRSALKRCTEYPPK